MYKNRKSERLEDRYSNAENVRTTRTLFVWCVASTTRNLIILAVNSLVGYWIVPRHDIDAMRAANCIFNVLIEAYGLAVPAILIGSHAELRKIFWIQVLHRKVAKVDVGERTTPITNVLGRPLVVDAARHGEEYFRQLRAAWNK